MSGIAFLRRLLMKQAMKKSKDASGIMSLNKNLVNDVETQLSKWVKSAKSQGQDIDKMGEQEIKYLIELNKPKGPMIGEHRVIDATSPEGKGITESLFGKKPADVLDLSGKKIPPGSQIMGGEEVKIDIVADTIATIKSKKPIDAMAEANSVIGRKGKYKNLTEEQSKKILKDTNDHIFERDIKYDEFGEIIKPDPEDLAGGGAAGRTSTGLNYLLGEDDQNSRVPLGGGKLVFDAARRKFLQLLGAGAAGTAAAKSGLLSIFKGGGKKQIVESLTQVPIKDISGMPAWFKPLVNKVIKEGREVSGEADRIIVHHAKLPESKTLVYVSQDLNTGNVAVDIGIGKHSFSAGHHGQPVRLEYRASEVIEPTINKQGKVTSKGTKTKPEFNVEEAEFTGGHPENIKFEETSIEKFGEHGSDFSEVEKFATGKTTKASKKGSKQVWEADWDDSLPDYEDFSSGGRVPLGAGGDPGTSSAEEVREAWKDFLKEKENGTFKGSWQEFQPIWIRANLAQGGRVPLGKGKLVKGLAELMEQFFPGTTKLGQTSKPMAEKTQLRNAIADFQEREAAAKLKASKNRKPTDEEWELDYEGEVNPEYITGDETIAQLDDMVAEQKAYEADMFAEYKSIGGSKRPGGPKDAMKDAIENASPGYTGELKYDAQMLADDLAEQRFGKEFDDLNRTQQSDLYSESYKALSTQQAKFRNLSKPTKTLEGIKKKGTIDISDPNVADEFSRFMKESDPKGFKDLEQKVELSNLDIKGKKGHAEGGRAEFIFGGSAGLRALIARLRGGAKTLFPKVKKDQAELGRLVDPKTMESIESINLQQLENMLDALKIDKKIIARAAENKAMKDPGLDFLMGKMKETGLTPSNIKKYTDIDNDIMIVEQMVKNKKMKGRKPNATGGRVSLSAGGLAGMLGE